jgi:hypothetical protein
VLQISGIWEGLWISIETTGYQCRLLSKFYSTFHIIFII